MRLIDFIISVLNIELTFIIKSGSRLHRFSWSAFQWLYTAGSNCGFQAFPTFGLKLYERKWVISFHISM